MTEALYGKVALRKHDDVGDRWTIMCRPQVAIMLKNVFQRASKGRAGEITLQVTDEVCRNLRWFLDRYPMEISPKDRARLYGGARRHRELVKTISQMIDSKYKARDFPLALPLRMYQRQATDIYLRVRRVLCADDVGLGKTVTALGSFCDKRTLPALVVCPANTMPQHWQEKIKQFIPSLTSHIVKTGKLYDLPKTGGRGPDVVIITYHKLSKWSTVLSAYAKSVIFDECQELRRTKSDKYAAAKEVADSLEFVLGLSATPIYNLGFEMWNVFDVIHPGVLGSDTEFRREWCTDKTEVTDPAALGAYLREQGLMIRRTRAEVGRELPPITKIIETVASDDGPLEEVETAAEELAKIILSNSDLHRGDHMRAAGELDWRLRQATGVAKAPHVASFVKMLVESGESVVVYGWHRSFHDILVERLAEYRPARFTGEETQAEKLESRRRFIEKETPVLLMSLRAGIGVDGFQDICRTVVFGELDWSHGVHLQCIGRVARDGQKDPTAVYFLVSDEGSDPVVSEKLGLKRMQLEGINNPQGALIEETQSTIDKSKSLAKYYLQKIGKWKEEFDLPGEASLASLEEDAS